MSKLARERAREGQLDSRFDYQTLAPDQSVIVQQYTNEIRERLRRSAQDIWEIGQRLADVRSRLKHGQFDAWLRAEFDWSRRTAYNFINVYETFQERANLAQINIATSALYLLAAPSTPQEIREEYLKRAQHGEKISFKNLQETIKAEKQSSPDLAPGAIAPDKSPIQRTDIIDIIPKRVSRAEDAPIPNQSPSLLTTPAASPDDTTDQVQSGHLQSGWHLLGKQHLLFCGDTASAQFFEYVPHAAFALAITSFDWDHDWIAEKADTVIITQESTLGDTSIKTLISMFSKEEDIIIFPWLPNEEMIWTAHTLNRKICAGDIDAERCRKAVSRSGLQAEFLDISTY
ncbi:MAG: DUF3102 domain-containing protein [Elainellaceae cyanobacterium]